MSPEALLLHSARMSAITLKAVNGNAPDNAGAAFVAYREKQKVRRFKTIAFNNHIKDTTAHIVLKKVLLMKTIYFVAGLGVLAGIYLWVVPPVKDYFADRRRADIEREQAVAEAETTLALERAKSRLENVCNADSVDFTTDTQSDTDGGTKPNTTVTATITANDGYFIYEPTIVMNRKGTREHKWTRPSTTPLPQVVGTSFENTILASASQSVRCEHENIMGTSSCTATSTISGKQLAIECIDFLIDKEREQITGN